MEPAATDRTDSHVSDVLRNPSQEWEELHRERLPYQLTLRVIGWFLDTQHACRANILELVDGFTIRYYRGHREEELVTVHLTYKELIQKDQERERKRSRRPFSFGKKEEPGRYEDVLRALGFDLDGTKSYSVLIDDSDEGMLVTYQYLNPSQSFMVRKRMAVLAPAALDKIVEDARARRGGAKGGYRVPLAG